VDAAASSWNPISGSEALSPTACAGRGHPNAASNSIALIKRQQGKVTIFIGDHPTKYDMIMRRMPKPCPRDRALLPRLWAFSNVGSIMVFAYGSCFVKQNQCSVFTFLDPSHRFAFRARRLPGRASHGFPAVAPGYNPTPLRGYGLRIDLPRPTAA
jgi:hypothetical protein